jgi:hypothetical protein
MSLYVPVLSSECSHGTNPAPSILDVPASALHPRSYILHHQLPGSAGGHQLESPWTAPSPISTPAPGTQLEGHDNCLRDTVQS